MFCEKCGKELKDGAKFCESCGAPVENVPVNAQPASQNNSGNQGAPVAQGAPAAQSAPKKPMDPKLVKTICMAGGAFVVVIAAVLIFFAVHKKTIDLQDYTKVTYEGYDGYGTASVDFDWSTFNEDFAKAAGIKTEKLDDVEDLGDLADSIKNYAEIEKSTSSISYELDKTDGLKNGDKVVVSFKFDNDAAKKLKIKFKGDSMESDVSGLNEVKEVDPFADLEVTFSGTSPNAQFEYENNSQDDAVKAVSFSADKTSDLKLGDKIKVTVQADDEDYYVENYGVKFTQTEKEYTVENVDAYVENVKDLDDKVLGDMKSQTEDVIKAYFADNKDNFKNSGLSYAGYYFLARKEMDSWYDNNVLYMVYSAKVKGKGDGAFKETTVYFPVKFRNIIKYADGTLYVDLNSTNIEGSTDLSYGWFGHVNGYTKKADMENELVTSQKSSYNDTTVDLK